MNMAASPSRLLFESAIRKEFIKGSSINPALFDCAITFESGAVIATTLKWKGFRSNQELHAAFFADEDGSIWHAKLSKPMSGGKKYCAPVGNENRAYLPPIPSEIRQLVSKRYGIEVPLIGSFWEWLKSHPEIPVIITEGGKKALSLLSLGYVAISLYGCTCGKSFDLDPYLSKDREITIAFDCDTKQSAIESVVGGILALGNRITEAEAIARVATWKPSEGKGVDDLITNCGGEAWEEVYEDAASFNSWKKINEPKQIAWECLSTHNYQIGGWKPKELSIDDDADEIQRLQARSQEDPNVIFIGLKVKGDKEVAVFKLFVPKCDFDFSCDKILSDSEGGGLMLQIRRVEGRRVTRKAVYIKSAETTKVPDFTNALKREFGQNLSVTLKPEELQALLQNRTARYRNSGGKTYKLADRTGQQDDGVWVFEDCQFKSDGTPTTEKESLWVFNRQLGETEKIPSPQIAAPNPDALRQLTQACQGFFHPETLPIAWFVCGYSVASLQRQTIMKREKCFPQLNLFGDPGGAKTTAAKVAVSLVGMHEDRSVISRFSESLIYEQVKSLSGLPLLIDDPVKKGMRRESRDAIDNFLWAMYNGTTRKVRGNEQTPHTNVIVTSNVALGEGNQAVESRLIKLHFPVRPPNEAGFPALEEAMSNASGGLPQLLGIEYDREAVRDIRSRLLEHLSSAHARISSSLALLTYFTQKFADVAGIKFDAFTYCVSHLCPTANDFESDKDSLADFLEKLAQMRSEGAVGDWNVTKVTSQYKTYLAVKLSDVWGEFDRRFSPNYSRQSIEQLIEGRGGKKAKQKFVQTRLEWTEYLKAKAGYDRLSPHEKNATMEPSIPRKGALRDCIMIPESEIKASYLDENGSLDSNFSDYQDDILEEDLKPAQPDTTHAAEIITSVSIHQSEPKPEHPHKELISSWVRQAGLTKAESEAIRIQLFGMERLKKWKTYSDSEMGGLKSAIEAAGVEKRRLAHVAAHSVNGDEDWV